jgi:hypothetical protein
MIQMETTFKFNHEDGWTNTRVFMSFGEDEEACRRTALVHYRMIMLTFGLHAAITDPDDYGNDDLYIS